MRFFYESNDLNETANITFIVKIRDFIAGANKGGLSLVGCLEWAQWNEIISEGAIFSPRTFALNNDISFNFFNFYLITAHLCSQAYLGCRVWSYNSTDVLELTRYTE